jgi:hypothetical protein
MSYIGADTVTVGASEPEQRHPPTDHAGTNRRPRVRPVPRRAPVPRPTRRKPQPHPR